MPVIGQPLSFQQKWSFQVEIDGVIVGGFTKAGPLKQSFGLAEQEEGGQITVVDITPTKFKTEPLTLERGGSNNVELWNWWLNQKQGIIDKRNVSVCGQDAQGNVTARWNYVNCVIKEFEAGDFDAKNETENIIEKMVLQATDMNRVPGP
jgi:phage tail-like protein